VRAALPPQLRAQFDAALDTAEPADLFELVGRWAALAQVVHDPEIETAVTAVRNGTAPVVGLSEVFPALAAW
jgi:hypothetical protein